MRNALITSLMLLFPSAPAVAQISINFGSPGVSIGVNLGGYPTLQRIPGYPVYYAPGLNSNYFFYDGLYWVYQDDRWYASSWYNGPWRGVDRFDVPVFLLRVPVRYYRHAPAYFRGWSANSAPRWGEHWGSDWQQRRGDWDRWDRKSAPTPAPLPTYQRQYSGSRYPQATQQAVIETRNYNYQPREPVAQQHFEHQRIEARSAPAAQQPQVQMQQPQQMQPQPQMQQPPQQRQQEARQPRTQQQPQPQPAPQVQQQAQPQPRPPQPQPQPAPQVQQQPQPQPQPRQQEARPPRTQPQPQPAPQVQPQPQPVPQAQQQQPPRQPPQAQPQPPQAQPQAQKQPPPPVQQRGQPPAHEEGNQGKGKGKGPENAPGKEKDDKENKGKGQER